MAKAKETTDSTAIKPEALDDAVKAAIAAEQVLQRLEASPLYVPERDTSYPPVSPQDAYVLRLAGFQTEGGYPNRYPLSGELNRVRYERIKRTQKGSPAKLAELEKSAIAERTRAEKRIEEIEAEVSRLQAEAATARESAERVEAQRDDMREARRELGNRIPPILRSAIDVFKTTRRHDIASEVGAGREKLAELETVLERQFDEVSPDWAKRQNHTLIDRREWDMHVEETVNRHRWEQYQREVAPEAAKLRRVDQDASAKEQSMMATVHRAELAWIDGGLVEALKELNS